MLLFLFQFTKAGRDSTCVSCTYQYTLSVCLCCFVGNEAILLLGRVGPGDLVVRIGASYVGEKTTAAPVIGENRPAHDRPRSLHQVDHGRVCYTQGRDRQNTLPDEKQSIRVDQQGRGRYQP